MDFKERLQRAAEHADVKWTQSEVARSLNVSRQTVFQWFHGTVPEFSMIAHIAKTWRVDPSWLGAGLGEMTGDANVAGLSSEERDIVRFYRIAPPQRRKALYDMAKALSKAMVVLSITIPGFAQRAEAGFNINKIYPITHWLRLLLRLVPCRALAFS